MTDRGWFAAFYEDLLFGVSKACSSRCEEGGAVPSAPAPAQEDVRDSPTAGPCDVQPGASMSEDHTLGADRYAHVFRASCVDSLCCGFAAYRGCFYELFCSTAAAYVLTAGHSVRAVSSRWCAAGKKLLASISLRRRSLLLRRHPRALETLRAFPQILEEKDPLDTARSSFQQAASATRCLSG